jgi:hypothetical protein
MMLISSCERGNEKVLNERVTIWRKDKIPYGTFYAYEQLSGYVSRSGDNNR